MCLCVHAPVTACCTELASCTYIFNGNAVELPEKYCTSCIGSNRVVRVIMGLIGQSQMLIAR